MNFWEIYLICSVKIKAMSRLLFTHLYLTSEHYMTCLETTSVGSERGVLDYSSSCFSENLKFTKPSDEARKCTFPTRNTGPYSFPAGCKCVDIRECIREGGRAVKCV